MKTLMLMGLIAFCSLPRVFGQTMSVSTSPSASQGEVAITSNGNKVLLKPNGTWELMKIATPKSGQFEFRKTFWGASKQSVKASETFKLESEKKDSLIYSGKVTGLPVILVYVFVDNKLVRTKYLFIPEHTNRNDYIVDFKTIKDELAKKYSTPKSDDVLWRNELYKDDYSQWGFAVSLGHLTYAAEWATDNTKIGLYLDGDNYKVNLIAEYIGKQFEALEENARSKSSQDAL